MANADNRTIEHDMCYICGFDNEIALEEHHIIPRALGGSDHPSNLTVLCSNCHTAITNMYNRWFFRNIWEIFEDRDYPPDLVKKNTPMGLKYNDENRLVPDPDDGFEDVIDALRLLDRGKNPNEVSRRVGVPETTVRELHENYEDYRDHIPEEPDVADLSQWS